MIFKHKKEAEQLQWLADDNLERAKNWQNFADKERASGRRTGIAAAEAAEKLIAEHIRDAKLLQKRADGERFAHKLQLIIAPVVVIFVLIGLALLPSGYASLMDDVQNRPMQVCAVCALMVTFIYLTRGKS